MRLFEYECDAVVVLDINNALLFTGGEWRPAGVYIARHALVNGTELTPEQFRTEFPVAAASLSGVDVQEGGDKPS